MKNRGEQVPKSLPQSVRENIIHHKNNGAKSTEIVKWLRIRESSVKRIWQLYQETKTVEEKIYTKGRKPAFDDDKMSQIEEKIAEQPDITLEE